MLIDAWIMALLLSLSAYFAIVGERLLPNPSSVVATHLCLQLGLSFWESVVLRGLR